MSKRLANALVCVCLMAVACGTSPGEHGDGSGDAVKVYSGRSEKLIGPLLERFEQATGTPIEVRYGSTPELVATLLEEGTATPADVFISQDAAALETLSHAGLLRELPAEQLDRVGKGARSPRGDWVGLSGRARVVVYNTERIQPDALPHGLDDLAAGRVTGSFGVAPTNASFQAHMAAFLVEHGEDALRDLLTSMARLKPRVYPKNSPIVAAVIAGEIDWGLVNHYYLERALQEDPDAPAKNFFMTEGASSRFMDMAGAARLSDRAPGATLLEFLLSETAQRYFTDETHEFSLANRNASPDVPAPSDPFDYEAISSALKTTPMMIQESGLTRFQ